MSRRSSRRLIAVLAVVALFAGLGGTAAWLSGTYRAYVVHTGSMEPALVPGDVVIARTHVGALRASDIVTFRASDTAPDVVTHRVAGISGDGWITTKGDANRAADPIVIRAEQVVGSVVARIPSAGYLVVYLRHPTGLMSLATTALCVVLLWELFFSSPATRRAGAVA